MPRQHRSSQGERPRFLDVSRKRARSQIDLLDTSSRPDDTPGRSQRRYAERLFACPFAKLYPDRAPHACVSGWSSMARVKEHLRRRHFDSSQEFLLGDEARQWLQGRSKKGKDGKELWAEMYRIVAEISEDDSIPSPYVERVYSTPELHQIREDAVHDFSRFFWDKLLQKSRTESEFPDRQVIGNVSYFSLDNMKMHLRDTTNTFLEVDRENTTEISTTVGDQQLRLLYIPHLAFDGARRQSDASSQAGPLPQGVPRGDEQPAGSGSGSVTSLIPRAHSLPNPVTPPGFNPSPGNSTTYDQIMAPPILPPPTVLSRYMAFYSTYQ